MSTTDHSQTPVPSVVLSYCEEEAAVVPVEDVGEVLCPCHDIEILVDVSHDAVSM